MCVELDNANSSDTEAPFLDLHLTISDGFVSSKIYDKRDDFDFYIVKCSYLDEDIPHATYILRGLYVSTHSNHVAANDINTRNRILTAKLLKQGYQYHKLRKSF